MSDQHTDPKVTPMTDHHDPALSALYKQSAQDQPPAALDARILQAAHTAAAASQRPRGRPAWIPLLGGVAATLLVTVLVVQLYPESLRAPHTASAPEESLRADADSADPVLEREQSKAVAPLVRQDSPSAPAATMPAKREQRLADAVASRARPAEPAALGAVREKVVAKKDSVAGSTAALMEADGLAPADPAAMFRDIVELWQAGNRREALARFALLTERFPDFVAPGKDREVFEALKQQTSPPVPPAGATE